MESAVEKIVINVEDYIPYVDSIAYRLCRAFGCLNDFDDLKSCGYFGLMEAVKRYDDTKNVTFKQFAYIRISGAILDGMRSLYAGSKKAVSFKKKLEEVSTRLKTDQSDILAEELGMSLKEFNKNKNNLNKMCRVTFTDLCGSGKSASTNQIENKDDLSDLPQIFADYLTTPDVDSSLICDEIWKFIASRYDERECAIMDMIYRQEMTMAEVGHTINLTECRISQIHVQIINDIKYRLFKLPKREKQNGKKDKDN
jgi:RNA polymerase sigma factor for flagellar operon FliA